VNVEARRRELRVKLERIASQRRMRTLRARVERDEAELVELQDCLDAGRARPAQPSRRRELMTHTDVLRLIATPRSERRAAIMAWALRLGLSRGRIYHWLATNPAWMLRNRESPTVLSIPERVDVHRGSRWNGRISGDYKGA
jgi:hypothetical protein